MRGLKRILLGLGALVVLFSAWAWFEVWRRLPDDAVPRVEGLTAETRVAFDGRRRPTIRAVSMEDAFRIQGYVVARERLFQMELMRRKADGRLAELVGAGALKLDRLHRIYGFTQVAGQALNALPEQEQSLLRAYASGVNAFIRSHDGRWALEFRVLGFRPEPWRPEDSLKIALLMHEDLSTTWKSEIQDETLASLPESVRRFLQPRIVEGDRPLVPDAPSASRPDTVALFGSPRSAESEPRKVALRLQAAAEAMPTPDPELRAASNNWVIAGSRTSTGRPILANDPHLDLGMPGIWFPVRLEWAGRFAQGVALPGVPGIVIGHNDRIAWGFTNLGTDVQDLYREPAQRSRTEVIRIKGGTEERLDVALGRHGPQVLPGLSLCWAALDPSQLRLPTGAMIEARDWESFNAAVDAFTGPAQNIVYADRDGHIGWRASGAIPLRRPGDDGSAIKDGSDPQNDWRGFLPQAQMPRVLDPADGFLATANNRVIGTAFPHPVATEWAGVSRICRIIERLGARRDWDADAVAAMQLDPASRTHALLGKALRAVPGGSELVPEGWTAEALPGDANFTRVELFRRAFRKRLSEALLGGTGLAPANFRWAGEDGWLLAAAQASPESWVTAGLGDKTAFLAGCLKEAKSRAEWNQPWGRVNELKIRHPFGLGGGILGWLFNPPAARIAGSSRSIRVMSGTHGQSMRMVVDLADLDATRLVLPLGVSGHLGSPHRIDQGPDWREGDPAGARTRLPGAPKGEPLVFRAGEGARKP
jgi:penicillin amidase